MIRTAISPRLAIRTRRNGWRARAVFAQRRAIRDAAGLASERDVAVLLRRVGVPLVAQHLERRDEPRAASPTAGSRRRRSRGRPRCTGWRTSPRTPRRAGCARPPDRPRCRSILAEDDVHRALRAHHRDLGRRPGEVDVAADVLAAHDVVRAAVGLAGDDREFRDRRLAVGVQQLCAVADDPAVLLRRRPGRKPGTSTNVSSGMLKQSQDPDESRGLDRTRRCPARQPARPAAARRCRRCGPPSRAKPTMMFCAQPGCISRKLAVVDDARDDVVHVVRPVRRLRDHGVERRVRAVARIVGRGPPAARRGCSAAGSASSSRRSDSSASASSGAAKCATPLVVVWIRAPPSRLASTSSCVTVFTTFGPVTNM